PEHLPDLNSFLLQNIFSDAETMPLHLRISLSDLQDLLSSTQVYVPEYPLNGTGLLYFSIICRTTPCFLPAYKQRSFPVFQTDGFCILRVLLYHEPLFLF